MRTDLLEFGLVVRGAVNRSKGSPCSKDLQWSVNAAIAKQLEVSRL